MPSTPPPEPADAPSTPHHKNLTRDERIQCRILALAGHTHKFIADLLKITERQVAYAVAAEQVTPKHRPGRPQTLTSAQVDELETYVRLPRDAHPMSYKSLATGPFEAWGVSPDVIRRALKKRGYARLRVCAEQPLADAAL